MRRLAEEGLSMTLAVSLHAPSDEKRRRLMPVANRYSMEEILDACHLWFAETGRRVTFEYALIAGENDGEEDARARARFLADFPAHVNLIPVNTVKEREYKRSGVPAIVRFHKKLEKYGINDTIRREMGADIQGACGQLRNNYIQYGQEKVT